VAKLPAAVAGCVGYGYAGNKRTGEPDECAGDTGCSVDDRSFEGVSFSGGGGSGSACGCDGCGADAEYGCSRVEGVSVSGGGAGCGR
jgi:hypothetical protein